MDIKSLLNAACVCSFTFLTAQASATEPFFTGLGDLPGGEFGSQAYGVSNNFVVVGRSSSDAGSEAFKWTSATGMTSIGHLAGRFDDLAFDVTPDGLVIVGVSADQAFRWTEASGMVGLGLLEGGILSQCNAVSSDGSVCVGVGDFGTIAYATFIWRESSGLSSLPPDSTGHDVSADGSVIVGTNDYLNHSETFRWTEDTGIVSINGSPDCFSTGAGVSDDGAVVVGNGCDRGFIWTEAGGVTTLGDISVSDVSGDGTVISGVITPAIAAMWNADDGVIILQDHLENELGLDLTGWSLTSASAISKDGRTIVGTGINPDGNNEAYIAHLGSTDVLVAIDIEKLTNGNQADDSNAADVPRIAQGDNVTWTYLVTNTGQVDLSESELLVTDSQPGITPLLDIGSDNGDSILSPGETWYYTATAQALDLAMPPDGVLVVQGCDDGRNTYQNTGRVEISGSDVFDEDMSHYCNFGMSDIDIRKQEEGPDSRTFESGADVTFEIQVTNLGTVDLTNVVVTDGLSPQCSKDIGFLGIGQSDTYDCTVANVTNSFENEACVSAVSTDGIQVENCDPSTVVIVPNQPPDCSTATAIPQNIWGGKRNFTFISISGITDPEEDPININIDSIYQDEPVNTDPWGRFVPDGFGVGASAVLLRAERIRYPAGNGRVYHIGFTADDGQGETCSGEVTVGVPLRLGIEPIDDGALFDSTINP